ncbi:MULTISPECIES: hypothetical protein [Marichromatium]|uniref:Uncharacterized protein n=1 Tax=Marichromatium gracile TaxID=1048 RepID=A0A4R4AKP5_MARGR|nr:MULTISPECIES: hypothetical protein [Marichromatium]TCW39714.1 hypothetical protein EDC29_101130 [Marichromatium gracile]
MEGSSLAALELTLFLGLVGWLVYTQYRSRNRDDRNDDDKQG